jgi:hypothetical protein
MAIFGHCQVKKYVGHALDVRHHRADRAYGCFIIMTNREMFPTENHHEENNINGPFALNRKYAGVPSVRKLIQGRLTQPTEMPAMHFQIR